MPDQWNKINEEPCT